MKTRLCVFIAFSAALCVPSGFSYTITPWSYEDLFAKSGFVVIAEPWTATRDTNERSVLRGVSPPVAVIGVNTEFKTLHVLKGSKRPRFVLHHFREPTRKLKTNHVVLGGPDLLAFEPPKKDHGIPVSPKRYLLFLVREADGRFAPVSGQQDPALISVQEVDGMTLDD